MSIHVGLSRVRRILCTTLAWVVALSPLPVFAQPQSFACQGGFFPVAIPPLATMSLRSVDNPVIAVDNRTGQRMVRDDLRPYIADMDAAIQLGKAFFWDMQVGSDNRTACATCHFNAGADARWQSQWHPGPDVRFAAGHATNQVLKAGDFPLPLAPDDIVGSQGVRKLTFVSVDARTGVETVTAGKDAVFNVAGRPLRQVTKRQAPTVVNAVFNHRNFADGSAQGEFNGVNPLGGRDLSAFVYQVDATGVPSPIDIHIKDASLASQAVGPVLSPTEMSAAGRTFKDVGRKLLALRPLGLQRVEPSDSVLGPLSTGVYSTGLTVSYSALIEKAFQPEWWNATQRIATGRRTSASVKEMNFSLYWGLAVMLYEATLVSDDSPMDRYLATRVVDPFTGQLLSNGLPQLLDPAVARLQADRSGLTTQNILRGLALFERPLGPLPTFPPRPGDGVGCNLCHVGPETTSASVRVLSGGGLENADVAFKQGGYDPRMERMFQQFPPVPPSADGVSIDLATYDVNITSARVNGVSTPLATPQPVAKNIYDTGWYNLGVRPDREDLGLGASDPFGSPLAWSRLLQAPANPSYVKVPGAEFGCPSAPGTMSFPMQIVNAKTGFPIMSGPLRKTESTAIDGSFKVSTLRNVELTGPYFHNGGKGTLKQVLSFYNVGGDFGTATNPAKAPMMVPLGLTSAQTDDLVAFLLSLTDERVLMQQAPFDHPQLFVPNGVDSKGVDRLFEVPATGVSGASTALARFLGLSPFATK